MAATTGCKLRIHYHMYGENARTLKIYTRDQNGGPWTKRQNFNGNIGDFWERAEINLGLDNDHLNMPIQVILFLRSYLISFIIRDTLTVMVLVVSEEFFQVVSSYFITIL